MTDLPENTPAQIAAYEENERKAADEATWPIYVVELSGDDTEWVNRAGQHWTNITNDEGVEEWVPKAAEELPDGVSISENGLIQMPAYCHVTCHAKNEDHAKAIAMAANPDYHTVLSVKPLSEVQGQ